MEARRLQTLIVQNIEDMLKAEGIVPDMERDVVVVCDDDGPSFGIGFSLEDPWVPSAEMERRLADHVANALISRFKLYQHPDDVGQVWKPWKKARFNLEIRRNPNADANGMETFTAVITFSRIE